MNKVLVMLAALLDNYHGGEEMKTEEYIAEVMPGGHLYIPEKVAKGLGLDPHARVKVIIEKVEQERGNHVLSYEAKRKALAIKKFISDMGPEDLSERFRERYK